MSISDAIDAGSNAAEAAIKKAAKGTAAEAIAKGAASGAATGTAVAEGVIVAGSIATEAAAAAGATGISAALATAGTGLATAATTIGTATAIGTAIPIPVLGSLIGLVVGAVTAAITAVVTFFNNRPPRDVARAILDTFRTYPNVLHDWVEEREAEGIDLPNTVLRDRWNYLAMLREQAGEKGPDPFENHDWQERFKAGAVEPEPSKVPPRLTLLGIHATPREADALAQTLARIRVPLLKIHARPVRAGELADVGGVLLTAGMVIPYPDMPGGPRAGYQPAALKRRALHVYKDGHSPIFIDGAPPFVVLVPTAEPSVNTPPAARFAVFRATSTTSGGGGFLSWISDLLS